MLLLAKTSDFKSVMQFFTVFALFLFVCVITYYTTKFTASYQKGRMRSSNIELLEAVRISGNKYIQIIRIGTRYLAVAICKDQVNLLCELTEEELLLHEQTPDGTAPAEFKELFDKIASKMKTKKQADKDEEL